MQDDYTKWFRCPRCGDSGETKIFLLGDARYSIKFACDSRQHQLDNGSYDYFAVEDTYYNNQTTLEQLLAIDNKRFSAELAACLTCPRCESDATDGAIEKVEINGTTQIHLTVWCNNCDNTDTRTVTHANTPPRPTDATKQAKYPPEYL